MKVAMICSDSGLAMTKRFEGLELQAYKDSGGIPTIGYGHTGRDVLMGMTCTQEQADTWLRQDIERAEKCVNDSVKLDSLQQYEFDALVDFTFNVGCAAFQLSTLLKLLNQNDKDGCEAQFSKWIYAGGKKIKGLVRRRAAEILMFAGHYG